MTDVISAIEADHREVDAMLDEYDLPETSARRKKELVTTITRALAQHSAAEEILVYPRLRYHLGRGDANHAIDEHQGIKRALANVDKAQAGSAQDAEVAELARLVREHVEEEEQDLLPRLRSEIDAGQLRGMGTLFQQMKPLLPTRSHPAVPGTATAQLLAGPLASVADRIRDLTGR
jgi:hemerythrin superfamily protein